jgi:hypothetical protein
MNTFWLKAAVVAVVVVGSIVVVIAFLPKSGPKPEPKTVYDIWEQDDKRLRADPQPKEPPEPTESQQPGNDGQTTEPTKPQFRELSEMERIDAERLFNVAIQHRKMGRLQGIGLRTMVDCCRQIIEKYPDSEYAFKAKRMLADIPERFRPRYNITEEEIDLGDWK